MSKNRQVVGLDLPGVPQEAGDPAAARDVVIDQRRVERVRLDVRVRLEDPVPFLDALVDLLAPGAVLLPLQVEEERAQRLGAVADQAHFGRVPDAQHASLDVDLDAARLPFLGKELRVRKEEPTMSSVSHSFIISQLALVPSRPMEPVTPGRSR